MSPQNSSLPDGCSAEQVRTMLEELRTIAALEVRTDCYSVPGLSYDATEHHAWSISAGSRCRCSFLLESVQLARTPSRR